MKKFKFLITLLISFGLIFSLLPIAADESDYAENESYYKGLCTNPTTSKANKEICRGYANWLEAKVGNAQEDINKYKGEISKYKDDLAKQVEIANDYEAKIVEIEADINTLNANIIALERNIERIEAEILVREAEIVEKDRIIIERMRKTQSDIRFGHEIDFLIKARDFSTLIASASVVNDIMDFESIQIEEINKLIALQKEDQDAIVLQKETVQLSIADAKIKKSEIVTLKAEVEIAIANYQNTMNELATKQSQATADANAVKKEMGNIYKALEEVQTSGGFARPISGGSISARVWEYPNGWGRHLGYDYAASVGTPIRAGANGVVLASYNPCGTYGGIGNWCGSPGLAGGGNHVILLVSVNNNLYALTYAHMQSGSPIASGQTVTAGQTIGRVGSSGNSSGPHTHVEAMYLGNRSINEYINSWNGSLSFNVGFTLANRCDFNGNNPPCRMDPGKAFGYN